MSNVNPIKYGIAGQYYRNETNEDLSQNTEKKQQTEQSNKESKISYNQVLDYMAAQNTDIIPVKPQKTVDVSKYVSEEQEARIEEFTGNLESDYNYAYSLVLEEFPELSEGAASELALAYINASYGEE